MDTASGEVIEARKLGTAPERGPDAVLADCRALAAGLGSGLPVGLAVCELVDPHGRLRSAETIDWRGVDLLADFAAVESDVRAGALAEARFGAGRDHPDFLYVTVSSGISHCLISDGVPRVGVRGAAIGTGAPLVEQWSGGLALARRTGTRAPMRRWRTPLRRTWSRTPRSAWASCSPPSSTRSTPEP